MYIVNNLKINILLESNILDFQKIHLDYKHEQLIIDNCKEMLILITITFVKNKINRIIRAFTTTTILSKSIAIILMRLRDSTQLSQDRNFMFLSY